MINLVNHMVVYIYIENLKNNKYCYKYKNILYLCDFLYEKRRIM